MPHSDPVTAPMQLPDFSQDFARTREHDPRALLASEFDDITTQTDVLALVERRFDSTMPPDEIAIDVQMDEEVDDDGPTLVRQANLTA